MKLSAFSVVDEYPSPDGAPTDRVREVVGLAEAAESAGLSALWVAEHHFHPGGVCPSPPVLLAACGARTRRLRLGALVSVLPFHRPIDVAEEYALLDRLLGGRLNLGVGSGYLPTEFEGYGVDPAGKREAFETSLATILAAFAGEPIRVDGERSVPVRINVRPVQQPHPPLWVAVQRREAVGHVARRGLSIALVPYATVADVAELAAEIREYREQLPAGARGEVAVALHLYAGPSPARAREALQRYLDSRLAFQSAFYKEKVAHDPRHARAETLEASGFALFGGAEEVATGLRRFADAGVDEVVGLFDFGGLPPSEVHASIARLGAAVRSA